MSAIYLDQLAAQRTQWLDLRQTLIAQNVANANTPGFRSRDLPSFTATLDQTEIPLTTTNAAHIEPGLDAYALPEPAEDDGFDATLSQNTVNLEAEMTRLGETGRDAGMVGAIKRIYHQMSLSTLK